MSKVKDLQKTIAKQLPYYHFSKLRSLTFLGQSLIMTGLQSLLENEQQKAKRFIPSKEDLALIDREIDKLFKQDEKYFQQGLFPIETLKLQPPLESIKMGLEVLYDSFANIRVRRNKNKIKDFKDDPKNNYPDYFLRNFHFQTDGYLSKQSAKIYEHQVEILFNGTALSMRRYLLEAVDKYISKNKDAEFKSLEIAAGTGLGSWIFKSAYPDVDHTMTDLSESYLDHCKEKYFDLPNVNFLRCGAEETPFKNESFDFLFHIYLFHEIPEKIRLEALKEHHRILKPGGHLYIMDSMQLGDSDMDEFILDFPRNFHEPFYNNYIKMDMEKALQEAGFKILESKRIFLSKYFICEKI